jgi:signal transduction histidine kinase
MKALAEPLATLELAGVDGGPLRLEELVDRTGLRDLVDSWMQIFGVAIRVVSTTKTLLAGPAVPGPVLPVFGETGARVATETLLAEPGDKTFVAATGELYRVVDVRYERRPTGRLVIGPFTVDDVGPSSGAGPRTAHGTPSEPPPELFALATDLEGSIVRDAWSRLPRVSHARVDEIATHLGTVLEVMLFSGHKALVTSQMHLASVQESYRELCEKNASLEEAYERLKELDRLKSNFLATVSHELRTPLTSIMGYGEMLAEGVAGPLSEEQREFVETIRAKSDQLLGLIMSLLDLSKLESGTMPVRVGRIGIRDVLGEAVSTLLPTAMKKGVTLDVDVPPDLPPTLGDTDRLRQVFINLTENAIKFTPAGGYVRLEARVSMTRGASEPGLILVAPLKPVIEVRVVDSGIGVAEEERERVFDPFYQIDQSSTREYGGAGLGLAIVRRLVEAHQGTIHVESNEPHGAVFVVTLPAGRTSGLPPRPGTSGEGSLPPIFG